MDQQYRTIERLGGFRWRTPKRLSDGVTIVQVDMREHVANHQLRGWRPSGSRS